MNEHACHLMCDIETLGTRPGSVVLSAAFVRFDDYANCTVNLSIPDQTELGLEIDSRTHAWWGEQDSASWAEATRNPQPLAVALPYIVTWMAWACAGREVFVWGHGASFDAPLLGEVFRRAGMPEPWRYNALRDTRTLYDLSGVKVDYRGRPHVALDDALAQTEAALHALRILAPARGAVAA